LHSLAAQPPWFPKLSATGQLQGGFVPSWHTTTVEPPGGTTTVVFAGGGGFELLMQPLSSDAAISAPAAMTGVTDTFIVGSSALASAGHRVDMLVEPKPGIQRRNS
jgi:hypothetical protein